MSISELSGYELKTSADYQQLVDDIESLMASPTGVSEEAVTRLHEFYDQAVKAVNSRLRQCDELLKKGLRNEAIDTCDTEPKLLDLFSILDFPERESWLETAKQCGCTSTELLVSIATELTDAAAAIKPLANLMYQMRLHALARSPLSTRIQVLRRLSKLDADNPLWEDDLKVFEKARHGQLPAEVQLAVKSNSFEQLGRLDEELQNADWLLPPPKALLKQVNDALTLIHRDQARLELQRIEPQLVAAFAAFDVPQGRQLRDEWMRCAKVAGLAHSDPLAVSVEPALNWLQDQDRQEAEQAAYAEALAGLTRALDKGSNRLTLEQKYHALMSLGQGIPDDLKLRLEERLKWLALAAARRQRLKLAAIAAIVLLVVSIGVFIARNAAYRKQVDTQASTLKSLIDSKQLTEAEQLLAKLSADSPRIVDEPELRRLAEDLKAARQADDTRVAEFRGLMDSARKDGVEQATLISIPTALVTLGLAWDKAEYESESAEVKDLTQKVKETQAAMQKSVDDTFLADVRQREKDLSSWAAEPLENLNSLQQLKTELTTISGREHVSDRVPAQLLLEKVNQSVQRGMQLQFEAQILQAINASLGDRAKYSAELERYVAASEFAGTSRQKDFQRALKEDGPVLAGYQNWNRFLDTLELYDLTKVDSARATKLSTDAEKLLKDHPGFWFIPRVQEALGYLGKNSIRERGSQSMEALLGKSMFGVNVARVKDKSDNTLLYYFAGKPPEPDKTAAIQLLHFIDTDFKTTKSARIMVDTLQERKDWNSPQFVFAQTATELLSTLREKKGANWDETFIELLGSLYDNPHMDKVLKVQLIGFVLRAAADGSDFLPRHLENIRKEIELQNLNPNFNWVDPIETEEARKTRNAANSVLLRMKNDLADISKLQERAEEALKFVKKPRVDGRHAWAGWLHRSSQSSQNWTCSFQTTGSTASADGELFLLLANQDGVLDFKRIGQLRQGRLSLDSESSHFFEGRPVFVSK